MRWTAILAAGLALAVAQVAVAETPAKPDAPQLAGYTRTGETASCLTARRIRSARILNDHQILFEMLGGPDYLNEPRHCPGLRRERSLSYTLTGASLCDVDIVRLLDLNSPAPFQGACSLDKFQKLDKKSSADAD